MKRFLVLFLLFIGSPVMAQDFGIAAIVNDNIISKLQVQERLQLVIATTGLSDAPETRKRLLPQIIRSLIDESLQLQAAKQNNIRVSEDEVDKAVGDIEKQRGKPEGSLVTYLTSQGVNPATFREQVRAQIAWNKLVSRRIGGKVAVSSEEIRREAELEKNTEKTKDEARISGFLLPVDKPENEAKTKALAEKLKGEIDNGASFDAIASQLGVGARGLLKDSWVDMNLLDTAIATKIREKNSPGMLEPVRSASGYHVIKLIQKRQVQKMQDAEVLFKEIRLSLDNTAQMQEVDVLMDIAKEVAKNPGLCREKGVAGIQNFEGLNIDINYTRTKLSALSPAVLPMVQNLKLEQVSEPFATPAGIQLLMLCEKISIDNDKPDRNKIREALLREKIDLEAMRYLRDLRREAFVEVRGA